MASTMKTSQAGRKLIKSFEGFRRKAAPLPGGGWVIGHGHTKSARPGVTVSEDDADKLLIYDLLPVETAINEHVTAPLTQNQFDALASLTLNIGTDNFLNSTVLSRLNDGRPLEAALAFDQWRCAIVDERPMVVDALLRRRAAERALFLTPPGGPAAAPTPEVVAIPEDAPAALNAPVVAFRPDLTGDSGGIFELIQDFTPPAEAAPEPQAGPELDVEIELEAADEEPAAPEAPVLPRAEQAIVEEDEDGEEVFVFEATESEPEPKSEPEPEPELEPEFAEPEAAEPEALAPEAEAVRPGQGMSWAELARERAKLARRSQAMAGPVAAAVGAARTGDDVLARSAEEWALDDDSEYTPRRETGAVWYALFLLIGVGLAAFGAWDTWERASGRVDEAFVYGPAVAGAGVLFMAIAGWLLIKRVLAFR